VARPQRIAYRLTVRNTLTTNRLFASIIYRFGGRWQP
jgi:hypothetical protein